MQRYFRRLLAGIFALAESFLGCAAKLPQALIGLSAKGRPNVVKKRLGAPSGVLALHPYALGLPGVFMLI